MINVLMSLLLFGSLKYPAPTNVPESVDSVFHAFRFENFRESVIYFRNKTSRKVLVNYHLGFGKLQFINGHGDTLLLTNKYLIDRIIVSGCEFILAPKDEDNDLEIVSAFSQGRIGMITKYVDNTNPASTSSQKYLDNPSSSIPTSLYISNANSEFHWQNTVLPLKRRLKTTYHFVDSNGIISLVSQKSLFKLYAKKNKDIKRYLRSTAIDFSNLLDIQRVVSYLDADN
ncbi:hypothetical protein LZD49_34740 [Dyadobacter sp. CY261]|uniref:hypothetical protein n=1 Tax=Dyadobacter sp. CY261 TaxID=2907203 RepID=UPI001F320EC8|nr:hypothetical protein [Dyadobacter sp. CY261]MCF0075681.1 hypothetical protein [Dyadobacter sp. CY261]